MKKQCKICGIEKNTDNNDFAVRKTTKGSLYFRSECKNCRIIYSRSYYLNNKKTIIAQNSNNKKKNRTRINNQIKERKKTDVPFKINMNIRSLIKITIKRNSGNKNKKSSLKYLNYSIEDLKIHLESQFEAWMTWENWGIYNSKAWNDNDCTTWTWQLDHIIPQSDLLYISLEDDNFKKCWALENLRPYSAKQNVIDGPTRARHFKKVA